MFVIVGEAGGGAPTLTVAALFTEPPAETFTRTVYAPSVVWAFTVTAIDVELHEVVT